eukprot:14966932-Alexandrium_andersonii.AAC.1
MQKARPPPYARGCTAAHPSKRGMQRRTFWTRASQEPVPTHVDTRQARQSPSRKFARALAVGLQPPPSTRRTPRGPLGGG